MHDQYQTGQSHRRIIQWRADLSGIALCAASNRACPLAAPGARRGMVPPGCDHLGQLDNLDIAYATSNLPLRGAKGWLYEGGIRVPLIVHWPEKGARGLISDVPVTSADFYPTLLEMAGLPLQPAQHVDGVSFARVVEGDVKGKQDGLATRSIFWHFPHYSNHGGQSPGGAIRSGPYKLLEYFENGSIQLFNLDEDIGEQVNLVDREPETARGLLAELHAWRKRVDATMPGRRIPQ